MAVSTTIIHPLLSQPPSSPLVESWLSSLAPEGSIPPVPTVKSYPDVQYHTYLPLGLDLIYSPAPPAQSGTESSWELDRIDIYNTDPNSAPPPSTSRRRAPPVYAQPSLPIAIHLAPKAQSDPAAAEPAKKGLSITAHTTGREFVAALGEPTRKGGAKGWVGPWLEWADLRIRTEDGGEAGIGVMVELRPVQKEMTEAEQKKGLGGVWDQAASWEWGCLKFFRVGSTT